MENNYPIYLKYKDNQAIIDNNGNNLPYDVVHCIITYGDLYGLGRQIYAQFRKPGLYNMIVNAKYCGMQDYDGENLQSFKRFVDHIIEKINAGKYLEYFE